MLLIGCTSTVDKVLQGALNYSDEEISAIQITPEEGTILTKRAAIVVDVVDSVMSSGISIGSSSIELSIGGTDIKIGREEKYTISVNDEQLDINVVYPYKDKGKKTLPVVLFNFGGGFVMGDYAQNRQFAADLSNDLKAVVVVAEYHLAPDYKFPVAHNDIYATWKWIQDNATSLNVDINKSAFIGLSAGACLTEGVVFQLLDEGALLPSSIVLLWPCTSLTDDLYSSRVLFGGLDGRSYLLSASLLEDIQHVYLQSKEDAFLPYASPLTMLQGKLGLIESPFTENDLPNIENHPPIKAIIAEVDMLRDEGMMFMSLLESLGVEAEASVYKGMIHGFAKMMAFPESKDARKEMHKFIKGEWK